MTTHHETHHQQPGLDNMFSMEATAEDRHHEEERARKSRESHHLPGLDEIFNMTATAEDRHREEERARKSLDAKKGKGVETHLTGEGLERPKRHSRPVSGLDQVFSMEATSEDRHHEEEKARKSIEAHKVKGKEPEHEPHHHKEHPHLNKVLEGLFSPVGSEEERKHREEKEERRKSHEHHHHNHILEKLFHPKLEAEGKNKAEKNTDGKLEKGEGASGQGHEDHEVNKHHKTSSGTLPAEIAAPF